jgi:hypothetical protein
MDGKAWYKQQLEKPEWKAKRAEIYKRDNYACVDCGSRGVTINCHHLHYVRGKKPWEYPSYALETVCDACHVKRHKAVILKHATHEEAEMWWDFAAAEAAFLEYELRERDNRCRSLEDRGAEWNPEGRYLGLVDEEGRERFFDEDGCDL